LGKPREGTITVAFRQADGGRLAISVSDDGSGLDLASVRNAAVRSRAVSAEQARNMSDEEATDLAFRAGVSTSPVISSISGHGLGLAIVRERIERVEGRLSVKSVPGAGTRIELDLPTTIATYRGLLVGAGTGKVLWPFEAVEKAIGIPRQQIASSLACGSYNFESRALPIGRLAAIFGSDASRGAPDDRQRLPAIVVRDGDRRAILLVDEVLGETEVVIKEIKAPLVRVRNVQTAGILGTGELVLVVRPSDVLSSIRSGHGLVSEPADSVTERTLRILIVDDSITTRTMERNLFEAAGYQVRTAADGVEALGLLQDGNFDLVVSDVDMPRMDGFELTQRVRGNERWAHLPIVLVTALETREDKERGVRVGANAYVLKSAFNQSNLLEIVRRLT
jgi:two-component system chemotaxis sensor kinase CheA